MEEDIFGSDFESTDEEAEKVGEAGENEVIYEERRIRKVRLASFLYMLLKVVLLGSPKPARESYRCCSCEA